MELTESTSTNKMDLLRNRRFRRLWAAQFSAITVVYGLTLAGAVLVEEHTHSSAQTGLVILSSILPAFLGSLVAGAVVDRWGRTQTVMAGHLIRGLGAIAFWLGTRFLPIGPALVVVYVSNAAGALFTQFAMTGELALLPDVVARPRLASANALFQLSTLAAEGLGIILLTPLLVKVAGPSAVGLFGAALFALAFVLVSTLPKDPAAGPKAAGHKSTWKELQAGWRLIFEDRVLTMVAIQATVAATLLLVVLSLLPGLLSRHLGLGVEDAPFLLLAGGLGFLLGSFLAARWDRPARRPRWIALGLLGLGVAIILVSLASHRDGPLWLVVPPILGVGLALAFVVIPARTILQERPPAALRGRVIAGQLALANAAAVIPLLLGGTVADRVGIRPVMAVLGILALGTGIIGLYSIRNPREQAQGDDLST